MPPSSLRITDFSDREFLALCIESLDADGWFSAAEVVKRPELTGLINRHVANRCSWLWRYGVLQREHLADEHGNYRYVSGDPGRPKWGQRWRLTEIGESLLDGRLLAHQRKNLEAMEDKRLLALTHEFTVRLREAPEVARNLMLREWRYGTHDIKAIARKRH